MSEALSGQKDGRKAAMSAEHVMNQAVGRKCVDTWYANAKGKSAEALFAYSKRIFSYTAMAKRAAKRHKKDWNIPAVKDTYLKEVYAFAQNSVIPGVRSALSTKPAVGLVTRSGDVYTTKIGDIYAFMHTKDCAVLDASESGVKLSTSVMATLDRELQKPGN